MTPPGIPQRQRSNISAQLARSVSVTDFGTGAWPMTGRGRLAAWNAT